MFVFVDESGADRRNILRKYGFSIQGKPATYQTLFGRGTRVSAIACMSSAGLLDVKTHTGSVDGECFIAFYILIFCRS